MPVRKITTTFYCHSLNLTLLVASVTKIISHVQKFMGNPHQLLNEIICFKTEDIDEYFNYIGQIWLISADWLHFELQYPKVCGEHGSVL